MLDSRGIRNRLLGYRSKSGAEAGDSLPRGPTGPAVFLRFFSSSRDSSGIWAAPATCLADGAGDRSALLSSSIPSDGQCLPHQFVPRPAGRDRNGFRASGSKSWWCHGLQRGATFLSRGSSPCDKFVLAGSVVEGSSRQRSGSVCGVSYGLCGDSPLGTPTARASRVLEQSPVVDLEVAHLVTDHAG